MASSGRSSAFEFEHLATGGDKEVQEFRNLIKKLSDKNLNIVLTLDPRIANVERFGFDSSYKNSLSSSQARLRQLVVGSSCCV